MALSSLSTFTKTILGVLLIAAIGFFGWWLLTSYPAGDTSDYSAHIGEKTVAFGEVLRNVSLTADEELRRATLADVYGAYVTPELIEAWATHPEDAIGRYTSSPWPERIELGTVTKNPDGTYTALGSVVEVASGDEGAVAIYPVSLTYENRDGTWLIREATKGTYTAVPERRTLIGTYECLPHKDTTGPQTLECAFGVKANDGTNYALDLTILEDAGTLPDLQGGKTIRVEGTFVPVENLDTDYWTRYDIQGIVRVTALSVLEPS